MAPKISVIIPSYNRAALVEQTVRSVLAQSFSDRELIIVDDGSTDDTHDRLRDLIGAGQCRYIYQNNQGRSEARNAGAGVASSTYLMFLDSDDVLEPAALQTLFEHAMKDKNAGLIAGMKVLVNDQGEQQGAPEPFQLEAEFTGKRINDAYIDGLIFTPSAYIVKRSLFDKVGGYDKSFEPAEDFDFFVKCCQASTISATRDVTVKALRHGNNTANTDLLRASIKICEKNIRLIAENDGDEDITKAVRRAKWLINCGNAHYSLAENLKAFRNYWAALVAYPSVSLHRRYRILRQMIASLVPSSALRRLRPRGSHTLWDP